VQEVLVDRDELTGEDLVEQLDDLFDTLHGDLFGVTDRLCARWMARYLDPRLRNRRVTAPTPSSRSTLRQIGV